MRRPAVILLLAIATIGSLVGGGRLANAQDPNLANHPAKGSWNVTSDPGDAEYSPRLVILSADGGAIFVSGYATTAIGAWEPAGESTANVTFTMVTDGPGQIVIRVSLEVAPDGQSFTGTFTNEIVIDPVGGITSGEIGPGTLSGTRMTAEGPGTPTQTFAEFFAVPGATPEATPVD